MTGILSALVSAVISFVATNTDDILILTALFASAPSYSQKIRVVIGQYLGIFTLILFSLIGSLGTFIVPKQWIGLLGVIPIYMGVKMIYSSDDTDEPYLRNIKDIMLNSNTYKIFAVTVSNGSDNLSIYIPMFTHFKTVYKIIITLIFIILTGIWCLVAYKIVGNPIMSKLIQQYGKVIIPIFLIGLGGYILFDNNSFSLFSNFFQLNVLKK